MVPQEGLQCLFSCFVATVVFRYAPADCLEARFLIYRFEGHQEVHPELHPRILGEATGHSEWPSAHWRFALPWALFRVGGPILLGRVVREGLSTFLDCHVVGVQVWLDPNIYLIFCQAPISPLNIVGLLGFLF